MPIFVGFYYVSPPLTKLSALTTSPTDQRGIDIALDFFESSLC